MELETKTTKNYKGLVCPNCKEKGFGKLFRWAGDKKWECWACLNKIT